MIIWSKHYHTRRPFMDFPRLELVSAVRVNSSSYNNQGRFRLTESHCAFQYTLRGYGVFRDEHREYLLPPGTGFLCKVNDSRTAYYYPAGAVEPWEFVYVNMQGSATDRMVGEMVDRYGYIYTLSMKHSLIKRWLCLGGDGGSRFMPHEEIESGVGAQAVIEILSVLLATQEERDRNPISSSLVLKALELMNSDQKHSLNATLLAKKLNVSREHLSRVFLSETGRPLYQYLIRQRLVEVCELLKNSTLSQKEIATRLKFGSPAQFTRTFKRIMHLTPSEFRRHGTIPAK